MTGTADSEHPSTIAYVASMTLPSSETETEQTIRSFEALSRIHGNSVLVAPRTTSKDAAQNSIEKFYQTDPDLPIRFFRGVGAIPLEAERLFNGFLAATKWIGRFDIIHTRSRSTVALSIVAGQKVSFETYRKLPLTNPFFFQVLRLFARSRNFLGVVCHSHQSLEALRLGGIPKEKLVVFRNGFDARAFEPRISRETARENLGLPPSRSIVTYAGNVQHGKGIDVLLRLAKQRPNILFSVVGGVRRDIMRIENLAQKMKVENVLLTERQQPDRVALHLQAADLLVIPPTAEPQTKYRRTLLPMKTFLYLGAGRPILAPDTPDLREVLVHRKNAWLVTPDALDEALAGLDMLLDDDALAGELAAAAAIAAAGYSWERRAIAMRDWLEQQRLNSF